MNDLQILTVAALALGGLYMGFRIIVMFLTGTDDFQDIDNEKSR